MRKLFSVLLFSFFFFIVLSDCSPRKDETKEKAILNYILYCGPGGTIDSCNAACGATYGETATNANLQSLTSCTSACSTNCNVLNLFLQFSNLNK
ncbi:hypothetical protein [Leptospira alstonii]|uniref:Lipoprotein n=2 Tax=Leptospira alstonii TaxID=28452 RepID=M6D4B1_9LEPT|nr:hypothetical protein [Leptospira alstonii]EMJ96053.1 hypothetical protein LEP1GSC194_0572 [Leptospira alstonii serovar Sichuan str. 79601]EQA79928.1 hypothetical protein LEP1GSC193_2026 [Leptospira alstonii serovar Pingchang str. 80-412]